MKKIATLRNIQEIDKLKQLGISSILIGEHSFSSSLDQLFDINQIVDIIKYSHDVNIEVIVGLNRLYYDEDLQGLKQLIIKLNELKVDFIEYSDPCVFVICKQLGCIDKLIYNPDALMCNDLDIQTYLDLNINSVVISKEITFDEIKYITSKIKDNLQLHVFGNIRMSYTKRKLLSNYLSYIDKQVDIKNRYDITLIESTRDGIMPIIEDDYSTSIYSDFVVCAIKEIKEIKKMNIQSIRFDGIFINKEIYYDVIDMFNKVLDEQIDEIKAYEMLCDKYKELNINDGYLYIKTNLVK